MGGKEEDGGQTAPPQPEFAQVQCVTECCSEWGLAELREAQNPRGIIIKMFNRNKYGIQCFYKLNI